jgi:hypothetical protein
MNLYNLIIQDKEEVTLNDVFLDPHNKEQLVQLIKENTFSKELLEYGLPVNNKILLQGPQKPLPMLWEKTSSSSI